MDRKKTRSDATREMAVKEERGGAEDVDDSNR
jgi:hypothetical protein